MPRRRNAQPLSEERLLDAALQLVDEAGIEALSMRRLGARLGIDPMAIYYYFPNKQALLQRLVETVFSSLRPIASEGPWPMRVFDWASAYRELGLAHPNLVFQIFANKEAVKIAVEIANESLHAALGASNLPSSEIGPAADTLVDYVHGFVLGQAASEEDSGPMETSFRFSVELIVGGIERRAPGA
jgi:AcrR family transcriptional regulator